MAFLVEQTIGSTTYIYNSIGYWDKQKKQTRHKRVCLVPRLKSFVTDTGNIKL